MSAWAIFNQCLQTLQIDTWISFSDLMQENHLATYLRSCHTTSGSAIYVKLPWEGRNLGNQLPRHLISVTDQFWSNLKSTKCWVKGKKLSDRLGWPAVLTGFLTENKCFPGRKIFLALPKTPIPSGILLHCMVAAQWGGWGKMHKGQPWGSHGNGISGRFS